MSISRLFITSKFSIINTNKLYIFFIITCNENHEDRISRLTELSQHFSTMSVNSNTCGRSFELPNQGWFIVLFITYSVSPAFYFVVKRFYV